MEGFLPYNCLSFPSSKEISIYCAAYPEDCPQLLEVYDDIVSNTEDPTTADFLKVFSKCCRDVKNAFAETCANDCPGVDVSDIAANLTDIATCFCYSIYLSS